MFKQKRDDDPTQMYLHFVNSGGSSREFNYQELKRDNLFVRQRYYITVEELSNNLFALKIKNFSAP
jgi:hypothetical protein